MQLREVTQFILDKAVQTDKQEPEHDFDFFAEIACREQRFETMAAVKGREETTRQGINIILEHRQDATFTVDAKVLSNQRLVLSNRC